MCRTEKSLLLIVAGSMLSFLLPTTLARYLLTVFLVAVLLIMLLLRIVSLHQRTRFDGLLMAGICLTVVYLVSFSNIAQTSFDTSAIVLFTTFYVVLAFVYHPEHEYHAIQHHTSHNTRHYVATHNTAHNTTLPHSSSSHISSSYTPHNNHLSHHPHIDPLPVKTPSLFSRIHHRVRHKIHHHVTRHFKREPLHEIQRNNDEQEFKEGIEPIPQVRTPQPAKAHDAEFKNGIEPVPDVDEESFLAAQQHYNVPKNNASQKIPAIIGKHHDGAFKKGLEPIKSWAVEDIYDLEHYDRLPPREIKEAKGKPTRKNIRKLNLV